MATVDDRGRSYEDWQKIMEKIDEGDTEMWDDAKDRNEGISFEDFDLAISPGFAEAFFAKD
jgi:hypothetical protein